MQIEEIKFQLRDGREALLRSPRAEDAEGALAFLRQSAGETEFIVRYPEECGQFTPEGETALFAQRNASPDAAMILCLAGEKIVGICGISFYSAIKLRHRCTVDISVLRDCWDQGIGTRMFQTLIRLAEERKEIRQMELEIVEGNDRARYLYEKMGFRIAGVHPDAIRLKDGALRNTYLMIKLINH